MKRMKALLGCLMALLLSACVPQPPAPSPAAKAEPAVPIPPTVDLATASIEFALEIKGDPEPLSSVPGLALDGEGNLLVIDGNHNRIQRFDPHGRSLGIWGTEGDGDGQFWFLPSEGPPLGGLAVDGEGHVYVADYVNCRVQKLDSDGSFLTKWGEYGTADGQFGAPVGVAVDGRGHVYVTDFSRQEVQKFDTEGRFLTKWPNPSCHGDYDWIAPAADEQGNVYVPSCDAGEVRKFDGEGKLLITFGTKGQGDGKLLYPTAVAVDRQGNVYVADTDAHCIQKFDPQGRFLARWGSRGSDPGQFNQPAALAVDVDGTIYVGELFGRRVQKFRQR